MKKLSVKSVVAIGIGAALFFVLGKISIPTPVPNTYISLQYAVQAVFAMLFGPIAGLYRSVPGYPDLCGTFGKAVYAGSGCGHQQYAHYRRCGYAAFDRVF